MKRIATAAAEEGGNDSWNTWRLAVADAKPAQMSAARDIETVLLVESETIMRSALAQVLPQLGYRAV